MEKRNLLSEHWDLILILIIYSTLAIFSINYHHYYLGADGISYLSIAEKYLNGDWSNAINGYWSPLYSWLMVPILFLRYNLSFAAYIPRIVSLIVGFFTIIGMSKLSSTFNFDKSVKRAVLITSIPMILFYSIFYDTPDVLVLCLLVYYFNIIFNNDYPNNWINGVLCGFLGSIAFLGKTYIFPFFLVHFLFFNFLYYFKGLKIRRKGVKQNLIIGLVIFLLISGIWIGTLSMKYDELTIGTTSEYNHAVMGPEYLTHPVYFLGLIKPPNTSATSTWEEPSLVKLNDWSLFESGEYFEFQLKMIKNNLVKATIIFEYYSMLSIVIIIISFCLIFKSKTGRPFKNRLIYIMITIFIYLSGYSLIFIAERYLWPVITLLMFCGFYLVNQAHQKNIFSLKLQNIFLAILLFSFIFTPTYELLNYPNTDDTNHLLAETLKNDYNIQGNIASNAFWEKTDRVSFYLSSQYYGLPKNINNSSELENELKANNIDYYFVWGDSGTANLTTYKEMINGRIQGLKVYSSI